MSKGSTVTLTDKLLLSFSPVKKLGYHQNGTITSLDFDDSGQFLISSGVDKSIQLYDVHKGAHHKDIQSQKYGAHVARFAHQELNCLYGSTQGDDDAIRYLSLLTNQYIRYFKGHKSQVMTIEVNPCKDEFISSSLDGTVKLWDLNSSNPVGNLDIGQPSIIGFDPQGMVFGIGADLKSTVQIYDLKSFDKSAFLTINVPIIPKIQWNKLEFSNNGKLLLVLTNSPDHFLYDSFLGKLLTTIKIPQGWIYSKYPSTGSGTFSPCGKFLIIGSPDNSLHIFDLKNIKTTDGNKHHVGDNDNPKSLSAYKVIRNSPNLPRIIAFDPKLLVMATADNNVVLWQPENELI